MTTHDGSGGSSYTVRVDGSDICFPVGQGERILGAARRSGVWLPFECGWGSCSTCKVTLVEGEVEGLFPEAPAIDARDERRRRILTCQSTPSTDLVIKPLRVSDAPGDERPTVDVRGTLVGVEPLGPGISRFVLALSDAEGQPVVAAFRPGQYALLEHPDGLRRCYSFAGLPGSTTIELVAKHYEGGEGSGRLFSLEPGDTLGIELPYGDMWLRESPRPILLAAGGTGISAILSLLRELAADAAGRGARRVRVVYGAATEADLVCWDEATALVEQLPDATLHGALVAPESEWRGTHGFVTHALEELAESGDHHDLGESDVYLAGPPVMVRAVTESLGQLGIQLDRLHVDSFG